MKRFVLVAVVITAFPLAAAPAAEPNTPSDGARLVCKGGQKVIGSRMRTPRRCRTEEQWRSEEEKASRKPETLRVGPAKDEGPQRPQ